MMIRDILNSKKEVYAPVRNAVLGKHQFNSNYAVSRFDRYKKSKNKKDVKSAE